MKRILIVTTISGFLPKFELNDVRILQEYGYTVHYASNFRNPVYETEYGIWKKRGIVPHQIDIEKSPLKIRENLRAYIQLKRILEKEKITLLHCHNPMGGVVGRLAARRSNQRPYVIYTAHGFHFYKGAPLKNRVFYYCAERFFASITDSIITINKEDFKQASRFLQKRHKKAYRIPGVGIDLESFSRQPGQRARKRQELGIPEEAFHVVSVGELNENKNHKIILEAMAGLEKDIYYSICGEGPAKELLKEMISSHGLGKRVRLLGYRKDVPEVLQTADCFAFPSKREGLGMAALEAMACGVPVVAADNRGTREYMRQGRNGFVCGPDNVAEFRQALRRMRSICRMGEPEQLLKMRDCCRRTALHFGSDKPERVMRKVYQNVEAKGKRRD